MGQEECESCGKRVYLMERLAIENHVFHRTCFKCYSCSTQLKLGSYEFDGISNQFYCRTHHRDLLRHRTAKRTIDERNLASPTGGDDEGAEPKRKRGSDSHVGSHDDDSKVVNSTTSDTETPTTGGRHGDIETTKVLATPTDVSRQESSRIRSELPSLLKTLATAKQDTTTHPSLSASESTTTTTTTTTTAVENGSVVAKSDFESTTGSPQQPSSGKQLPEKQLSGQQIVGEREGPESRQRGMTGAERERGEKREEEMPPVKPPRRRTTKKKFTAPQVSLSQEAGQVSRGNLALFSCYIYLLCGLVLCWALYYLLSLFTGASNTA